VTWDFENDRLLVHEIFLLERLVEIQLDSLLPFFDNFDFSLGLLLGESNVHQLLYTSLKIADLDFLVGQGVVKISNV